MKKIIPFKKDIIFKTNLSEITSISLEHTLHFEENNIVLGNFIVSGDYKITDTSINTEEFSYDLPFEIHMDDHYILDKANVDINDFYYEIINENVLSVNIEVMVDQLEEQLIEKPILEEVELVRTDILEDHFEEEEIPETSRSEGEIELDKEEEVSVIETEEIPVVEEIPVERCIEPEEKMPSLFDTMDDSTETYQSYKIYIVREGDTLETIMEKYSISKEELDDYNDLKEMKIGAKIIIPTHA